MKTRERELSGISRDQLADLLCGEDFKKAREAITIAGNRLQSAVNQNRDFERSRVNSTAKIGDALAAMGETGILDDEESAADEHSVLVVVDVVEVNIGSRRVPDKDAEPAVVRDLGPKDLDIGAARRDDAVLACPGDNTVDDPSGAAPAYDDRKRTAADRESFDSDVAPERRDRASRTHGRGDAGSPDDTTATANTAARGSNRTADADQTQPVLGQDNGFGTRARDLDGIAATGVIVDAVLD